MRYQNPLAPALIATALILTGCATTGTDLLPVTVGNPDDDLLPVEVDDPADDLLPINVEPLTGRACLPGIWLLENASWQALVAQQAGAQGVSADVPTGEVLLTFTEAGRYSSSYKSWEIRMSTADGTSVLNRDGTDTGGYSADASTVTLTESTAGSVFTGRIETSSGTIALPNNPDQASFAQSFSYECDDDELIATVPEGSLILHRVP